MELNGWCAPDYHYLRLLRDLKYSVNAHKGTAIEQSYLYLDGASADDWLTLASREDYSRAFSETLPIDTMADLICMYLENSSFLKDKINILGLGSGDAKKEDLLLRALLKASNFSNISCQLFDLSQALLNQGFQYLKESFAHQSAVTISHHSGNFLSLAHYKELFDSKEENRLNVVCMFGGTFGNLQSELHFLRHSLHVLNKGDLFLLDVVLTFAPVEDPEAIYATDPRLKDVWQKTTEEWIQGPIKRYRKDFRSIRHEQVLKIGLSPFRNSYTIEKQAIVNEEARFTLLQLHRYDPKGFIEKFEEEGWRPIGGQTFGINNRRLVYLFQKL